MNQTNSFMYAFLEDLQAKALLLEYNNAAYNFIVVLPNERTGLSALESNLRNYDFKRIISKMDGKLVNVTIPKFEIEFELKLVDVLQKVCSVVFCKKQKMSKSMNLLSEIDLYFYFGFSLV